MHKLGFALIQISVLCNWCESPVHHHRHHQHHLFKRVLCHLYISFWIDTNLSAQKSLNTASMNWSRSRSEGVCYEWEKRHQSHFYNVDCWNMSNCPMGIVHDILKMCFYSTIAFRECCTKPFVWQEVHHPLICVSRSWTWCWCLEVIWKKNYGPGAGGDFKKIFLVFWLNFQHIQW